jgi:hypothetical protein
MLSATASDTSGSGTVIAAGAGAWIGRGEAGGGNGGGFQATGLSAVAAYAGGFGGLGATSCALTTDALRSVVPINRGNFVSTSACTASEKTTKNQNWLRVGGNTALLGDFQQRSANCAKFEFD